MFCSKCGNQVNASLNYCNICGAKMAKEKEEDEKYSPLNALITSISFVALGGLGILIFFISMLLGKGLTHEAIAIISIAYLATLFGICFGLIRLMSKLIDANSAKAADKNEIDRAGAFQTGQPPLISIPTNPQLGEYKQPVGSVTDHTTKTFDEAFVKRN